MHCCDADTPLNIVGVRRFNGQSWEESYAATDIAQAGSNAAHLLRQEKEEGQE